MEKYCKKCGRVFDDLNFKICPYCGSELATRYGRQPIPRKLRHEVFKRDGYRCRECGASKDETSLEIDHILPVAKGGTNDIDNLQTLCRECNRMKHTDEWVGGSPDLKSLINRCDQLKKEIAQMNDKLKFLSSEDEIINLKFNILKFNEELIDLEQKIPYLKEEEKKKRANIEETKRKRLLYRKLYVTLDDKKILLASRYLQINSSNKDEIIKSLIKIFDNEKRINEFFNEFNMYNSPCPKCGHIAKKKSKGLTVIKCRSCGHTFWF